MKSDVQDPRLLLKVTPPRLPKSTLLRERLSFGNIEYRDRSIIEVSAPAGFGKTTLLGQWRREALNQGSLVAWLTLDANDHGNRFVQGLAYAMRLASGRPGFDRITAQKDPGTLESLTSWLAEVTFLGAETCLIFDEVQSAPASTLQEHLLYLALNAPPNLRIVLASRRGIDLHIPDIVAYGHYANIGVDKIRLTQAETTAILTARFGTKITSDDCVRLHEKIGGWPLGLQLALASIEPKSNLSASIDAMASVTRNFEQYFLERFVSELATSTIDFLEQISILDALDPDLCRTVTRRDDAPKLLDSLREALPIFMDGAAGDCTRLHPMALDYLRSRLATRPPAATVELHERAARWFIANQMPEEAATHALAAGNDRQAYELIGSRLHEIMAGAHQTRVLDWYDRIPATEIERHPDILVAAGWALAESARHTEAETVVAKLNAHPSATEHDRFEGVLIRTAAEYYADRPDAALEIFGSRNCQPVPESPFLNATCANARATFLLFEGKPEQARQLIGEAEAHWPDGVEPIRGWAEWVTGFSYLWEGQIQLAIDSLQASMERSDEVLGRRTAQGVMFAAPLAEALVDAGRIDDASNTLADRLDVVDRLAAPQSIAMGYRAAARIAIATGQERRAFDLLEYLYALGKSRGVPRFCINSLCEQVRIHALRGHRESCVATGRRLDAIVPAWGDAPAGLLMPLLKLRVDIARAFAALAARDWRAMLEALSPARETAERLRRGREQIDVMLLTSLAQQKIGEDANPLVQEAASLASIYGYKANLRDAHPGLFSSFSTPQANVPSFANARQTPPEGPAPTPSPVRTRPRARACGLLTAREEEALKLLDKNFSNKQIAASMGASNDTVKWHIRNLFAKLNAGSRRHAVERARMLGILPDAR